MKLPYLAALAAVVAAPSLAQGQVAAAPSLSRASVGSIMQSMFAAADVNRDGFVTAAEASSAQASYYKDRADRKHAYALRHDPNALWAAMDANRDGAIARGEFDTYYSSLVRLHGTHMASANHPVHPPRMGLRLDGPRFSRGDTNKDGKLSLQEAVAVGYFYFDRMDGNRDGFVTAAEREAYRQRVKPAGKAA